MSEHTDFAQLAEDLSPEDMRSVLTVFASDVKRLTGNLADAAAAGDVSGFKRVAHGLAGAAGAVGARALEQACRALMVRSDLAPSQLAASSRATATLAEAALAALAAFVARLDKPAGRG
jgi:HPt (histidine-containing phosphotransfer) domain-containing protein